jgi:hypothetical protein
MGIDTHDANGKPRSTADLEAALKFVEAELMANPLRMGPKDTGPAVMHYLVIREVLKAAILISGRSPPPPPPPEHNPRARLMPRAYGAPSQKDTAGFSEEPDPLAELDEPLLPTRACIDCGLREDSEEYTRIDGTDGENMCFHGNGVSDCPKCEVNCADSGECKCCPITLQEHRFPPFPTPEDPDAKRTTTLHGTPKGEHLVLQPDGMQKDYIILTPEERAKGFIRPVRRSYTHLTCGGTTTMHSAFAETYAREPGFYKGTFCAKCRTHFPVGKDGEFVWAETEEKVGT